MSTFASLFTGGGLADIGAIQAGLTPIWGVELQPEIAEIAQHNLKHDVHCSNILDCNPHKFDRPDILWCSPPCPNFSIAKTNAKETELDQQLAIKIVDFIKVLMPRSFILENVEGYKRSQSLEFIEGALYALGYWIDRQVFNSADFGVPQTRKRLILRAVLGGFPLPLPAPVKWKGWYEAIEDLIPTLPETQFAEWQLKRLPEELISSVLVESRNANQQYGDGWRGKSKPAMTVTTDSKPSHVPKAFLVDVGNTIRDCTVRSHDLPSITVTAEKMRRPASTPKAFLLNRNQTERDDYFRESDRPSYTVCAEGSAGRTRAFLVDGQNARSPEKGGLNYRTGDQPVFTQSSTDSKRKAWLEQGKVVAMTSRALGRFQTLPDWYELPTKNSLACRIIGNGVPCKLAEEIVRTVS